MRASFLVVDDEWSVLEVVERMLGREPVDVVVAGDADRALALCAARSFDVVVSDFMMPRRSGLVLLAEIRDTQPLARRMLLTAFPTAPDVLDALNNGTVHTVLEKPFRLSRLVNALMHEAMAAAPPA